MNYVKKYDYHIALAFLVNQNNTKTLEADLMIDNLSISCYGGSFLGVLNKEYTEILSVDLQIKNNSISFQHGIVFNYEGKRIAFFQVGNAVQVEVC